MVFRGANPRVHPIGGVVSLRGRPVVRARKHRAQHRELRWIVDELIWTQYVRIGAPAPFMIRVGATAILVVLAILCAAALGAGLR